ncbi:bifunctional pyridoxamine 5'-phosphate oxidase family protein/GNAT family N-acetyltransferase [Jidongwangia harbinensis]|uniref:bifunctional pyridoxamine 5'-phosphate oxidase family protein/GNAT family N-acetyltransferase n=1 Tax=Jidongwangia harbinensis TaxID=2878561 RepID=UPI001CD96603|nr:bifunctional pyridoxamine 5'-phosphate oxidase family protein/GNAT family N-acetyltransferase [Jidongwangia harbinensis]MCA2215274.1 bifunctional pyridoxamine 5'-phosphate oxidase family protein/GNAT family N-acetyltransferase [Jidongwangia harbinensis]
MTDLYTPTARTTATRNRSRMHYERAVAHAILDEAYDCAVGFVVEGEPRVLPTLHVRVDDTVYLHGSTGGRLGLSARGGGVPVCLSVTLLDGIVYGRSQFHHSANYRSVVALGTARPVTGDAEKRAAMTALVEKVGRGRASDARPPTRRELAETSVLALPLTEVSVRARAGGVVDEPEDHALPYWAGVLPLRRVAGPPEPDTGVGAPPPDYLTAARSPWHTAVPLRGRHVHLEQLAPAHVDGLCAALADDEVWRYLTVPRPAGPDEMATHVSGALRAQWLGERVPWVQRDPVTGAVLGMTMYHDVDENARSLSIGHTILGRSSWRTGVNTESKLLLLERAFDVLGAERVCWYTDIRNERSQRAIARLGATREGVLRRHRQRADGSWRDSVLFAMTPDEWPAAAARLRERLARGGAAPATA